MRLLEYENGAIVVDADYESLSISACIDDKIVKADLDRDELEKLLFIVTSALQAHPACKVCGEADGVLMNTGKVFDTSELLCEKCHKEKHDVS